LFRYRQLAGIACSVSRRRADHRRRLTALKDAVDPGNLFHLNHNIQPSH
jgi:hypothetical protein